MIIKPCPLCGGKLTVHGGIKDWSPSFYDPDSGGDPYIATCECGFYFTNGSYEYEEFIKTLNRRASIECGIPNKESAGIIGVDCLCSNCMYDKPRKKRIVHTWN